MSSVTAAKTAAKRARAAKHQRARLLALAAVLDDLAERSCLSCAAHLEQQAAPAAPATKPAVPAVSAVSAVDDVMEDVSISTSTSTANININTNTNINSNSMADEQPLECTCQDETGGYPRISTDALLARSVGGQGRGRGAISNGAAVCALVYVGRVHACNALRRGNCGALLLGALALSAAYVDRKNVTSHLARISGLPLAKVVELRDGLIDTLSFRTYISPATFREFDAILDDLAR